MTDTNLKFSVPKSTSHPVDMLFGTPIGVPDVSTLSLVGKLPVPVCVSYIDYDNATLCRVSNDTRDVWQPNLAVAVQTDCLSENASPTPSPIREGWRDGVIFGSSTTVGIIDSIPQRQTAVSPWGAGVAVGGDTSSDFNNLSKSRSNIVSIFEQSVNTQGSIGSSYRDLSRFPRPGVLTGWSDARHVTADLDSLSGVAKPLPGTTQAYWQFGRKPPPGKSAEPSIVVPPKNGCYTPPVGSKVDLLFSELFSTSTDLLFKCENYVPTPGALVVVPVKATYMITNQITLKRVDTGVMMEPLSFGMTIDKASWTWGFSLTLPASALALVSPDQFGNAVMLEVTINGDPYRFIAESIKRDRTFGKSSISVSGRGQSALLSDPYSSVMTFSNAEPRTAQQLMVDVLTENGVGIGWDVEWHIDDWLVPSGAWSHRGTRMSALTTIATAAGAFIQPHNTLKKLLVLPNTKVAPWNLSSATPDIELPSASIIQESVSWENRADYDSIYVSGTSVGGVLGQVKRIGSAGAKPAPMVTDALITSVIAARQRGIYELSKFGRVVKYQLNMPILQETGIIMPGKTVRYVDNGISSTGTTDSVQVNVSLPNASQTINLTTYV
jgi:hypothetical protein